MSRKTAEPVFLTKNGAGDLVVMDIETYNRREKMLKLREELLAIEEDRIAGRSGSSQKKKRLLPLCVPFPRCRSVFLFLRSCISRRISITRCLLKNGFLSFTKSKTIRYMWNISLTAARITVGLSDNKKINKVKSSLPKTFCEIKISRY